MAVGPPPGVTDPSSAAGTDLARTDLTGTRVLITGGTSGIGLAMARVLAGPGHGESPAAGRRYRNRHAARRAPPAGPAGHRPRGHGAPIVWLASAAASGVHDERIAATEFAEWLRQRPTAGA